MKRSRWLTLALLAGGYVAACRVALLLAFVNPSATAIWPGTGLAVGAMLILGYSCWPAILLAAFVVNLSTAGTPATAFVISLGNVAEGLVITWAMNRWSGGRLGLDRTVEIFKTSTLVLIGSALTSPTIGVVALISAGLLVPDHAGSTWLTWWLGNVSGAWLLLPIVLHWANHRPVAWDTSRWAEATALVISAVTVTLIVFSGTFVSARFHLPLEFLMMPIVAWAAFRFNPRAVATLLLPVAAIAIWGTLEGNGPFLLGSWNASLLLLQGYMGVLAIMALVLAAEIVERRKAEWRFRQLAVSDPVTGLPNYRQLVTVLDNEIRRSQRTVRTFAVLFLDLDGLKVINDKYGHLVGSRALSRLADVLAISCRSMDTAARFGGDEFALVLPETGEPAARQVAQRVVERLAADTEDPRLSVSVGLAIYPRDGDTSDALLGTADKALYVAKGQGGGGVSSRRS